MEESSAGSEVLRIVCQRVTSGRLLVNAANDQWAAVPAPGGLVFLTGFQVERSEDVSRNSAQIDEDRLRRAAHSLLGAPLACGHEAGWQEDHSETIPVAGLVNSGQRVCITMIPQACLAGVIPLGQKTVKYNRQVEKEKARKLWLRWVVAVAVKLCELVQPPTEEELASARRAEAAARMKAKAAEAPANPRDMFKEGSWAGKFSSFAEDGMPLTDAESGEPVSKSQMKKLFRIHAQQKEKWERYVSKPGDADAEAGSAAPQTQISLPPQTSGAGSSTEPLPEWLALDSKQGGAIVIRGDGSVYRMSEAEAADDVQQEQERARLVWGTFGGRQSWEARSTGPFTHSVDF